jgi:sarcosine oxidase subunit gamma
MLPRLGFKGRGTIEAMRARGITVEATPNRAFRQADGSLCLVLAPSEVLILSGLDGNGARFAEWIAQFRLEDEERTYPLLRRDSHFWIAVSGRRAPEMFAKICAIDMRLSKFPDLAIAQTSVAKMSAIVVRCDLGSTPVFHLLADVASALYFSTCLLDAAREFGGELAGLRQLETLDAH